MSDYEAEIAELIAQRDYWEARATELAQKVGEHFGFDVGEHSNLNCPVLNALEYDLGRAYPFIKQEE